MTPQQSVSALSLVYSRQADLTQTELSLTTIPPSFAEPPTLQHVYSFQVLPEYGAVRPVIFEVNPAEQVKGSPLPAQQSCPPWPLGLVHLLGEHCLGAGQHLYSFHVLPAYGAVCPVILAVNPFLHVKGSPLPAQQSNPPWPLGLLQYWSEQPRSAPGQQVYSLQVLP